jgi:purine nucleosidase
MNGMDGQVKVLLDTDIGNDIDDAIALAYLLAEPRCELLGVTTVTADPARRAGLVRALCEAAGRDVPVFAGAAVPLLRAPVQGPPPQAVVLPERDYDRLFCCGEAVEFARHAIRSHPGEVVLVAIGPLTNVALLFAVDPELPRLLRGLVLMAGAFAQAPPDGGEWNIRCDPEAAALTYRASVPVHRSVGLDVTLRVSMESAEFRRRCRAGGQLLRLVGDMAREWPHERVFFHDPLAVLSVFEEGVCSFQGGAVTVSQSGETSFQPAEEGPHEVAIDVAEDTFFDHLWRTVRGMT